MDYYFIAKTKDGGFIGQYAFGDIAALISQGVIRGDYVATKSIGPSYNELMKSGNISWITVADLIPNPPIQSDESREISLDPKQKTSKVPAVICAILASLIYWTVFASNSDRGDDFFADMMLSCGIASAVYGITFGITKLFIKKA
jgi:hypothetical protein